MSSSFSGFRDTEIKESIIPIPQINVGKTVEIEAHELILKSPAVKIPKNINMV